MEKRKRAFGLNYLFSILYHLCLLALPLVTTPYLSRVLGATGVGRYSFVGSVASCFALLATLGTTLYGQRLIARVAHSGRLRTHFFLELLLLRLFTVLLSLSAYFLLVVPRSTEPLLYAVAAVEILAVAADVSWFYRGLGHFGTVTLCTALGRVAAAVCVFLFVKTREDLILYAAIYTGALLFGNLLLWCFLHRYLVRVKRWRPRIAPHALSSMGLFAGVLAIQLYTVVDKTMLGLILRSDVQNGYYEQAQKLIHVLVALVTAAGAVVASRVSVLWREKKKEELHELLLHSFRLTFALSVPLLFGVILIAPRFTPLFYGEGFSPVSSLLALLSPLVLLIGMSNVLGIQLFAATGRESLLCISVGSGALVNILFNLFLIPRYAALGAAVASVLAELTVTVVQCMLARREIHLGRVLQLLGRYFALAAVMSAVGVALLLVAPAGALGVALTVAACAAVYLLLLWLLHDPVFSFLRTKHQIA